MILERIVCIFNKVSLWCNRSARLYVVEILKHIPYSIIHLEYILCLDNKSAYTLIRTNIIHFGYIRKDIQTLFHSPDATLLDADRRFLVPARFKPMAHYIYIYILIIVGDRAISICCQRP